MSRIVLMRQTRTIEGNCVLLLPLWHACRNLMGCWILSSLRIVVLTISCCYYCESCCINTASERRASEGEKNDNWGLFMTFVTRFHKKKILNFMRTFRMCICAYLTKSIRRETTTMKA